MARVIPLGTRAEAHEIVEFQHTLTAHHPELPPVYSTPDMIRLIETAGFHALQPFCEKGKHRAASGIGATVTAEAVLESFDGKFYLLRVTARDNTQEIGRGTITRAVVNVGGFLERMKTKGGGIQNI